MSQGKRIATGLLSASSALALALAVAAAPASAADFVVNTTTDSGNGLCEDASPGDCTLRDAITAAAASFEQDTITFSVTGTIDPHVNGDFPTFPSGTQIQGPGAGNLTIDCADACSPFSIPASGGASGISGITIENGTAADGGAIHNLGELTLSDVVLKDNKALAGAGHDGGAIYNGGSITLVRTTLTGNSADHGGGIYNDADSGADVEDSTISGNGAHATGGGDGFGGGIDNAGGNVFVSGSTFAGNTADGGGGAIRNESSLYVTDSTLARNMAGGSGGAIDNFSSSPTPPTADIVSSTVVGNEANSDASANPLAIGGGFEQSAGTDFKVTDTLLAANTVGTGGGTGGAQCGTLFGASYTDEGYNLRSAADSACTGIGAATGDIVRADPLLGPLAANGGPTDTIALLPGSPAIDAGSPLPPGLMSDASCRETDQRGLPRSFRSGANFPCDIGSYEVQKSATGPPPPPPSSNTCKAKKRKHHKKRKKCKKKRGHHRGHH